MQSNDVVTRIAAARQKGRLIEFCKESSDNDYPELKWQIFGLIDTNEVAVVGKCGEYCVGSSEKSWLLYPSMADRIFGIDQADLQLAHKLTEELWALHSAQLMELAQRIRACK